MAAAVALNPQDVVALIQGGNNLKAPISLFDARYQPDAKNVKTFGAVGDGVVFDDAACQAAINAAGVNGNVLFPSGSTFLLSGVLTLLQGQTIYGYGATIKRCNVVATTTTTNITTGGTPPPIVVADASNLRVGMDLAFYTGDSSSNNFDTQTHRILTIVGNTITVGTSFTTGFAAGCNIISAFGLLFSNAPGVKVFGLSFEGNRANNANNAKWYWQREIWLGGNYCAVENCYLNNCVSEGMIIGGDGTRAERNIVTNAGGNGIHFAGCKGARACHNFVQNVNLTANTQHADGCIIFSTTTGDSIIIGNYCENGIAGISSIDSDDNSSVIIQGNIIKSCTTYAIEGVLPATNKAGRVVISGNLIYNSVVVALNFTQAFDATLGPYNWIIEGNYLEATTLVIKNGFECTVVSNQIKLVGDTTSIGITLSDCQQVTASGNNVREGANGIYVTGVNTAGVKVFGNTFRNQNQRAVNMDAHTGRAVSVEHNTIIVEAAYTAAAGWLGIVAPNNTIVNGNVMDVQMPSANTGTGISCPNGGVGINGAIVMNNIGHNTEFAEFVKKTTSIVGS